MRVINERNQVYFGTWLYLDLKSTFKSTPMRMIIYFQANDNQVAKGKFTYDLLLIGQPEFNRFKF